MTYPKIIARFVCAAFCAAPLLCTPHFAGAQLPGLPPAASPTAPEASSEPATPVRAAVMLDANTVFAVTGDTDAQTKDRAELISVRLQKTVNAAGAGQALPHATVRAVGADTVIVLGETPLLTVTQADANAASETVTQLASEWATKIDAALGAAQRERQPGFLRAALLEAAIIVGIAAVLHLAVWLLARRFLNRPGYGLTFLVWLVALNNTTDLFPQTRPLHNALSTGLLRPLFIVIVVALGAVVLARGFGIAVQYVFPPLPDTLSPEERTERNLRRRATLGTVARVTGVSVIWIVAGLVALTWIGVNLPALLASAGLIGVAIGLAAQDSMKDLVAGVNILADDRFGVGDIITVGEHTGTVEKLNLRITQIRNISGNVVTFPNRTIETVVNATLRWAQVDFMVGVAYETNLRRAMTVMEETAGALHQEWSERVLDAPQMLGVDSFNASDITLRMTLRTLPGDQWAVGRELRLRVKEAFDAAGIVIAFPQNEIAVKEKDLAKVVAAHLDAPEK